MRKVQVDIPDTYCNEYKFFTTYIPDPESCTGSWALRQYWCYLFNINLSPDRKQVYRKAFVEEDEKKVPIPDCCKDKIK